MKRFRFPLRPVAVLRAHRESRAQEIFAVSVHRYVQAVEILDDTRQRVARLEEAMCARRQECFNAVEEAFNFQSYRREAAAELAAEQAVITARDVMNQRRTEYLEAHRQCEVLRRLETKARSTHRVLSLREEQAEFDDRASRRAAGRHVVLFP